MLSIVNELQEKPGCLRCFGAARQVSNYGLMQLKFKLCCIYFFSNLLLIIALSPVFVTT